LFLGRASGEPTGLSSRREGRRNDAAGLADGEQTIPMGRGNNAATVGCMNRA
jgi:hypothetical protein